MYKSLPASYEQCAVREPTLQDQSRWRVRCTCLLTQHTAHGVKYDASIRSVAVPQQSRESRAAATTVPPPGPPASLSASASLAAAVWTSIGLGRPLRRLDAHTSSCNGARSRSSRALHATGARARTACIHTNAGADVSLRTRGRGVHFARGCALMVAKRLWGDADDAGWLQKAGARACVG